MMIERRFTTSDGIELFYLDYGPADGVPVAICHGIAVNSSQFTEDADYLAARGFRVLTPDLRGHGRSGVADPKIANYTLERLALDQVEMLDHAGIGKVHWVGNSLGGMAGLSLVAGHPNRLSSMATFGTPYRLRMNLPGVQPFIAINFSIWRPFTVGIAAALCSRDGAVQKRIRQMASKANARVLGAVGGAIVSFDYREAVERSVVPVMLMSCRRDLLMSWGMMRPTLRWAKATPKVQFVELAKGGHCANLDATADLRSALLDFWRA
jgi:3-oxoadipate enol-lactonase